MFPAAVWDGLSAKRRFNADYMECGQEDFNAIVAQLQAAQQHLIDLKDANGAVLLAKAVAAGSDPVVNKFNDYLSIVTKDIVLPIGSSAVANVDVAFSIPAASIVLGAALNIQTAITLATATKIGLGVTGALAKYGSITGGTLNNKSTVAITPTALATADALKVYATDNSSAAAGTVQNGSIRIRLTYLTQIALADA